MFIESSSKKNENENLFIPASMGYDQEMVPKAKDWVETLNPDSKLPNFNTGIILVPESQAVNKSLESTKTSNAYELSEDCEAESLTPLPPLKNLQGALPSSETESSKSVDSSKGSQDSKPKVHNAGSSKILYDMICKREDHRTSDHEMYTACLKKSKNYKAQLYQYASSSKQILQAKANPFLPCTQCGFNYHKPDDC
ncbi:hypothetical protein Tco_1292165 [Tanacetum coccineum]